jgi:predicted RNase H-like HicB family nuclease
MASSTIFKNFTVPVEKKSLLLIANDIASGKYKAEVEEIRALLEQGKTEEAANKKKQLLAFTPSAVFSEKRQMPFLEMYSGFVHLDFDKLTPEQLDAAFKVIAEIPYTFLCFISPSGNGLKVFIEVNTEIEHHDIAYLQVQKHYEDATGLKADPSCKDITRLCFMSYHPGLFKNIRNEKFKVQLPEIFTQPEVQPKAQPVIPPVQEEPEEDLNIAFIFNQQIQFTNQKTQYTDGNRNNYIYRLASNCNRAGLSQSDTELLCTQHFDLPEREIKEAV